MPRVVTAGVPEADAAGDERRLRILGNGVLVDGDAGVAERLLGHLAGEALGTEVDQHEVRVGAARDDGVAALDQRVGQRLRIFDDARGVRLEIGVSASLNATALAAMTCSSGPPCVPGNTDLSMALACSAMERISPARGPRSVLCVVLVTIWACGTGDG